MRTYDTPGIPMLTGYIQGLETKNGKEMMNNKAIMYILTIQWKKYL